MQDPYKLIPNHGDKGQIENWQIRNWHGFYQSRESAKEKWKFHVASFGTPKSDGSGICHLTLVGGGHQDVPIDAHKRITVRGVKYAHNQWVH